MACAATAARLCDKAARAIVHRCQGRAGAGLDEWDEHAALRVRAAGKGGEAAGGAEERAKVRGPELLALWAREVHEETRVRYRYGAHLMSIRPLRCTLQRRSSWAATLDRCAAGGGNKIRPLRIRLG